MKKAVFFDRDGVINVDRGYVSVASEFAFMEGVFLTIRDLVRKGFFIVIVTNQSGIGRGYYSEADFRKLNGWMLNQFSENGISIGGVYYCPHAPEAGCSCRKPSPGMFLQAIQEHDIDPSCSWMLGDKDDDMIAARAAGVPNRVLLGAAESMYCTHRISSPSELQALAV